MKSLSVTVAILLGTVSVQGYLCPQLTCAMNSVNGQCFSNQGSNPVTQIKFYACQPGQICNIDDMNYAWYQTSLQ